MIGKLLLAAGLFAAGYPGRPLVGRHCDGAFRGVEIRRPKKLSQIDAVFVTVEPNGGSHTPSGQPLLFTYLKVEPNHP